MKRLSNMTAIYCFVILHLLNGILGEKPFYRIGSIFEGEDLQKDSDHAGFNYAASRIELQLQKDNARKFNLVISQEYVDDLSDSYQMSVAICRLVAKGVMAIFGPIHYKSLNTVRSFTDKFDVVYFTSSAMFPTDDETFRARRIIKMRPVLTPAFIDFFNFEQWSDIIYLYDTDEALLRLREIFENFHRRHVTLSTDVRQINDEKTCTNVLKFINKKSKKAKKRIVVDVADPILQTKLFDQIHAMRMNRYNYHYVLVNGDIQEANLTTFIHGGVNISGFSLLNYSNPYVKSYIEQEWRSAMRLQTFSTVMDKDYPHHIPYDAALMIDAVSMFVDVVSKTRLQKDTSPRKPEVCISQDNRPFFTGTQLTPEILQWRYKGLTGDVSFNGSNGFRTNFTVGIQEIGVQKSKAITGRWNSQKGLYIKPHTTISSASLQNKTRIVTSISLEPFLKVRHHNGRPLTGNDRYEGFCVDLTELIARKENFPYVISVVKDGKFGIFVNDSWNGMIGELDSFKADMAVAPLTITAEREAVVDFSKPYMEFGLSVMYLIPVVPPVNIFSFMTPLSPEIWMCIAFALLGVSVVLFLVSRFSPYEWHVDDCNADKKVTNDFSIFNSVWFSISAFMQQGGDISPQSLSGRIVGSVWWFFTLIIVSSYTANLAAFLTVERMSSDIKSYEDLARQNKIKYGVANSGSSVVFFQTSQNPIIKRMWQYMSSNMDVFVPNIEEGYRRVNSTSEDYAFILESTMNDYFNQRKPCRTTKVGSHLDSGKGYGIATPPGSDIRGRVGLTVLELKELNTIHERYLKWWKEKGECPRDKDPKKDTKEHNSLELKYVAGLFYILIGGFGLGIALAVLEFFYRCGLEAKRERRDFRLVVMEMVQLAIKGKLVKGRAVAYNGGFSEPTGTGRWETAT